MGVVYDELYISTMREMDVCTGVIRQMEKIIGDMEKRYHLKTSEFMERFTKGGMENNNDFVTWHASYERLKHWEGRLKDFEAVLQNAKHGSMR